jgi:hypothetical protein
LIGTVNFNRFLPHKHPEASTRVSPEEKTNKREDHKSTHAKESNILVVNRVVEEWSTVFGGRTNVCLLKERRKKKRKV